MDFRLSGWIIINGKKTWIEGDQQKIKRLCWKILSCINWKSSHADFTFKDSNYVDIKFHSLLDKAEYTILVFGIQIAVIANTIFQMINAKYDSLKTLGAPSG